MHLLNIEPAYRVPSRLYPQTRDIRFEHSDSSSSYNICLSITRLAGCSGFEVVRTTIQCIAATGEKVYYICFWNKDLVPEHTHHGVEVDRPPEVTFEGHMDLLKRAIMLTRDVLETENVFPGLSLQSWRPRHAKMAIVRQNPAPSDSNLKAEIAQDTSAAATDAALPQRFPDEIMATIVKDSLTRDIHHWNTGDYLRGPIRYVVLGRESRLAVSKETRGLYQVNKALREEAKLQFWKLVHEIPHPCERIIAYKAIVGDLRGERVILDSLKDDYGYSAKKILGYEAWDMFSGGGWGGYWRISDQNGEDRVRCLCRQGGSIVLGPVAASWVG